MKKYLIKKCIKMMLTHIFLPVLVLIPLKMIKNISQGHAHKVSKKSVTAYNANMENVKQQLCNKHIILATVSQNP